MSSSCKPKPRCFGRDIHRLLLAAEAGQKADILAYSSGHLGPHSLNQSQPRHETKQSFWRMSRSQDETPNPLTLQQRRTKALAYVKKKEMKGSPAEFTAGTALVDSEVLGSRKNRATDRSCADRKKDISLPKIVNPRGQKKSNSSYDQEGKQPSGSGHTDQVGSDKKEQLIAKPRFGRQAAAMRDLWDRGRMGGTNVAEMHEKKLQKELKKLSVQSWPSSDRLAVFSDVFDDVCEGSPVFGHILREIKTNYDLYLNHLMASQSSSHDMTKEGTVTEQSLNTSLRDVGGERVELEAAETEVCRLEQEASRALEENKRARNELQNVPAVSHPGDKDVQNTSLSGLEDSVTAAGCTDTVQTKRLQVLNAWKEVQQLEEEIKKMVSIVTTTATERHIKDLKSEIVRLIASNERLKTTNKDLENNINTVLSREKASKAIRRMLWDEIQCDLQTE